MCHINLAEFEAVLKGVNMELAWGLREIEILCDSATVCSWVRSVIVGDRRVQVHGLSEVLEKRRLFLLEELVQECCVDVKFHW